MCSLPGPFARIVAPGRHHFRCLIAILSVHILPRPIKGQEQIAGMIWWPEHLQGRTSPSVQIIRGTGQNFPGEGPVLTKSMYSNTDAQYTDIDKEAS